MVHRVVQSSDGYQSVTHLTLIPPSWCRFASDFSAYVVGTNKGNWVNPLKSGTNVLPMVGITNASFYDSQTRSNNQYSLEPIYDKTQVDIRPFNILYWPSKDKHRHKFIKKSHLLRNDA